MRYILLLLAVPLLFLGCNSFSGNPNNFVITVKGQTFAWSGNSMTSLDGKAIYLRSVNGTCGGRNVVQMWEGSVALPDFTCSCFIPNGQGNFNVGEINNTCANMIVDGPWPYALISGVQTTNGSIATPYVHITHVGVNKIKGTISGTVAESNQDGTFTEVAISGSFILKKM